MTRVYVPTSLDLLAGFRAAGEVPAGPDRFVAAEESEEAEYDALCAAAEVSATLVGTRGRRLVVVAELPDPDAAFGFDRVAAVHADPADLDLTGDSDDLPDLGWFATQEIEDLLAAR